MKKIVFLTALFSSVYMFSFAQVNDAENIAKAFITEQQGSFGESQLSIEDLKLSSQSYDRGTQLTHVYMAQVYNGIDIYNAISGVHLKSDGSVFYSTNGFVNVQDDRVTNNESINREVAIDQAAKEFGFDNIGLSAFLSQEAGTLKKAKYENDNLSIGPITVNLIYVPTPQGLVLCWDVQFTKRDDHFMWNVKVDAHTGAVVLKNTYTLECLWDEEASVSEHPFVPNHSHHHIDSEEIGKAVMAANSYNIFPIPAESPIHGPRTVVIEPWNKAPTASPFGWHDTDGVAGAEFTITRGNNVHAYLDRDGNSFPEPGSSPDGGATLMFDFPLDLVLDPPVRYQEAATTNLFYMNNVIHDVMSLYGFDPAAGNFQVNNYGAGGLGGDAVNAECQSGADVGASNNAFFGTPPDGNEPTMMMFEFTFTTPRRDSDFDNGIIAHEYGHGVSNRLTGGPGTSSCLSNGEQMGEGWSDYVTLIMGMLPSHTSTTTRGMGTYVLGQPIDGAGVRTFPYTTDILVNTHTYADVVGAFSSHLRGSIWAEMLWEMTWALIDKHGFEADIYNASSSAGNILALQLVNRGMKLQPCSPGFVDGRDAILAADVAITGGANQCEIWTAFAKRGLGFSADQGSSNLVNDGTAAFDLPPVCIFSCDDGMQNGDETGVDCGGSMCPLCPCTEGNLSKTYTDVTVPDMTHDRLKDSINTSGTVNIANGTSVIWRAGKAINVNGTFSSENNSNLEIQIEDCEEIGAKTGEKE